ncbi:288_t:CDS:2, partial [Gigaspora margarita]
MISSDEFEEFNGSNKPDEFNRSDEFEEFNGSNKLDEYDKSDKSNEKLQII